ncbi:MAG: UDP-N-acetylmuramoyl-tripeptide--D-alanyl-D-alanine ligase [Bacteroidetes bacterium 4572_77]|nr:MAG: UDP-N-acetylmuramoyl-tripeptide--D-alanyl-D-alanine ligase [Bacteroidetes bacterium 4572_77]
MTKLYQLFQKSSGVSIDTRSLKGEELFFCLKGENFNGNKFAQQAIDDGASFVVMDDKNYYSDHENMILVDDSLKTLQLLAKHHRAQFEIPVIGITGSNGKTTTKELIYAVLKSQFPTLATAGNFNNHIGVPLTLLGLNSKHQLAIIEMGANHPGEIAELCEISQPNYGIITNIGKAHLEGFGNYETIIKTKTALYDTVAKNKGILFVNADDSILVQESFAIIKETYSITKPSPTQLTVEKEELNLCFSWNNNSIRTQLIGQYNAHNAAAAIAIGSHFKVSTENTIKALQDYTPSNNRSQLIIGKNNQLIMDAYNANPSSMAAALENFSLSKAPNKAVVLGDMLELGSFEEEEHHNILQRLQKLKLPQNFLVGSAFYKFKESFPDFVFFKDQQEAKNYFFDHGLQHFQILVKGSRGIRLEQIQEELN